MLIRSGSVSCPDDFIVECISNYKSARRSLKSGCSSFLFKYFFICLTAPGLGCGTRDLWSWLLHAGSLAVACWLLAAAFRIERPAQGWTRALPGDTESRPVNRCASPLVAFLLAVPTPQGNRTGQRYFTCATLVVFLCVMSRLVSGLRCSQPDPSMWYKVPISYFSPHHCLDPLFHEKLKSDISVITFLLHLWAGFLL